MEYPIIDTLTNAYIRNGWTGLTIETGKNLFDPNNILHGYSIDNNGYPTTSSPTRFSTREPIFVNGSNIILSYEISPDINYVSFLYATFLNGVLVSRVINQSNRTVINIENVDSIAFTFYSNIDVNDKVFNIQLEYGTEATPYEPYKPPITDIFSRTRLPLIRYFPHPVIDALQRASDGTMTADDVQVLRHYLTKFGIGNIELGRFHAINPNVSNDIKEIDLDPFPIDEPIKEKKKTGEEDLNVKTE